MTNSLINEDELPTELSDYEYAQWFKHSFVPDGGGCRVGPRVIKKRIEDGMPDYEWVVESDPHPVSLVARAKAGDVQAKNALNKNITELMEKLGFEL